MNDTYVLLRGQPWHFDRLVWKADFIEEKRSAYKPNPLGPRQPNRPGHLIKMNNRVDFCALDFS